MLQEGEEMQAMECDDARLKELLCNPRSCVFETRLACAEECREFGNRSHKRKEDTQAIEWYERALYHLEFDEGSWLLELMDHHREQVSQIRLPLYLNLAACFLAQSPPDAIKAREMTDKALNIDPVNSKALYRNGKAHLLAGNHKKARAQLKYASTLLPHDPHIRSALKTLNEEEKEGIRAEKSIWGGRLLSTPSPQCPSSFYSVCFDFLSSPTRMLPLVLIIGSLLTMYLI
uniref:Uncharacterized protein AlNc14C37G3254 n=1 Tax=Albugo laibachii Nc14 TaxID=890382 RepID=F0W8X9_9STRA|nr:conserved hypothetical protein [Albugo laibachii Nc14]|eukprot:CCA17590.1 conserved hypothetical protein [Albugo laibachii Nc14]